MNHDQPFYSLKEIQSRVDLISPTEIKRFEELNQFISNCFSEKGWAIFYMDYQVLIGTFENGLGFFSNEPLDPKYMQRLRVFNDSRELLMWRTKPCYFNGRLRTDGGENEEDVKVVDSMQVLWGTVAEKLSDSWFCLSEERGTELILPLQEEAIAVDDKEKRVKLKARNYIGYNPVNQAGYTDCRFIEFFPPENV